MRVDLQVALTVLSRVSWLPEWQREDPFEQIVDDEIIVAHSTLNMTYTDLRFTVLPRAKLGGANLTGANLQFANLEAADLDGASLARADFRRANFREARFQKANLQQATFRQARWLEWTSRTPRWVATASTTATQQGQVRRPGS